MNSRKHRALEEAARAAMMMTPNSSVKSSLTVVDSSGSHPSETRDSFYFPGCKKDANCKCEICIASINATLDLVPPSTNRSSFTKSYAPRAFVSRSPISFDSSPADLSTPRSSGRSTGVAAVEEKDSPPLDSTERFSLEEVGERREEGFGYGVFLLRTFWFLSLLFGLEFGVSMVVSRVSRARISPDFVKNLGLKSRDFESLNGRFVFLKNELELMVGGDVSSCSSLDNSLWKINQDGLLLTSRCVLYKSMIEEVKIWGWPLQTDGVLTTEHSKRSFTVINGRVREWSNGEARFLVREGGNSSWTQGKWSTSVVQLESNTWILEYRRSFLGYNPKLVSAAVEFLRFKVTSHFKKMKREFWLASAFGVSDDRRRRVASPT